MTSTDCSNLEAVQKRFWRVVPRRSVSVDETSGNQNMRRIMSTPAHS
jgi:hypothetical protein